MNKNESITSYGLFSTIVVTTVGIGIFSYPRTLAETVGNDGWIVTIITGVICYIMLYIIWLIVKKNDFNHFSYMIRDRLGRVIGDLVMVIFALYHLIAISLGMRTFVEVVKMYLLEKTPTEFLLIITILIGTYLIRGGMGTLVKFNEVTLMIMFIPMFIILLFLLNITDFTNLLPVLKNSPDNYLKAIVGSTFTFGGLSIAFMMAPFLKDREEGAKVMRRSILFITIFYTIIVVLTIAVFSKYAAKDLLWPTITMIKSINLPGTFVERWEGVVMALWILYYFTTFVNGFFFSSYIVKEVFILGDLKISSLVVMPLIYLIAMYPDNIAEVFHISNQVIPILWAITFLAIPVLLLILSRTKRDRRKGAI
jgi:spore germination protein